MENTITYHGRTTCFRLVYLNSGFRSGTAVGGVLLFVIVII
jgi:hypothetical protein